MKHGFSSRQARARILGVCLIAAMALLATTGCEKPDWTDPAYVSTQLETGDGFRAMEEIQKLPEDKQRQTIPALINAYNNDKQKEKALDVLVTLRDKAALNVYVDALKNSSTNAARGKAAIALGDLKATDQIPTMIDTFKKVPNEPLRRSILEAFVQMPDPQVAPLIIEILETYDPDREPIAYHSFACDIAAKMTQVTDSLASAVAYGVFLDNAKGQNVFRECSAAVFNVGSRAVPQLLTVLQTKNEKINRRFARYKDYTEGSNEIKAADVLGYLRAPSSVDALIQEVTQKKEAPASYRDQRLLTWGQNRIQLLVYAMGALGDIGDAKVVEPAIALATQKKEALEPYKAMTDYDKRSMHDIVLSGIDALNAVGDRKNLETLGQVMKSGDIPQLGGYAKEFVYQSRWEAARAYARLGDASSIEQYDKIMNAEKVADAKKKFAEFRPMLDVAKECRDQVACYGRHLAGKDMIKAEKAAWELGRLPGGGAELAKSLGAENLSLRKVIITSLFKAGSAQEISAIDGVLNKETSRRSPEYKDVHFKMKALRSYLGQKKG